MKKKIFFASLAVLALVGLLAAIKFLQIRTMIDAGSRSAPPPETVTATTVQTQTWESLLTAVGSLEAVQGVTVTAELAGKVIGIAFEPGATVAGGDLLLQQDISSEEARLPGAEAALTLTRSNLERNRRLLADRVISQAEYDSALANHRQAQAEVAAIRAAIGKKTLRAPFPGRLGIRLVNLGQILSEGDPVVSLQTLDPIFANFLLPQQQLRRIRPGLPVQITTDALPGERLEGKITTINPQVDAATRNLRVQATLDNPGEQLRPGMFVNVSAVLPEQQEVLAIPATAVLYAPYGDSVFVVEEPKNEGSDADSRSLRQQFVRLGKQRGDFVAVTSGLQGGETVVTTGVFKLRNGQTVRVDNTLAPEFQLQPSPAND